MPVLNCLSRFIISISRLIIIIIFASVILNVVIMNEFALINASKMKNIFNVLSTVELKMLLMVLYYLSSNNKELLVHNADFRDFLASVNFSKTPERISTILASMVKKGVLVRESIGVYSVSEDMYLPFNVCKE